MVKLTFASWAGTISPDAMTPPPLKRGPGGVGGAVAIGVAAGVGEPLQPTTAIVNAIEMDRTIARCLAIILFILVIS
jgi:hypothetical protein